MLLPGFGQCLPADITRPLMTSISHCIATAGWPGLKNVINRNPIIVLLILLFPGAVANAQTPFSTRSSLFDQTKINDLGLTPAAGTETVTIFKASASSDHYSNGVVMVGFKGYLYCQWQSSDTNEDSPDTWVAYSRSKDGKTWTAPMKIAGPTSTYYCTSGGWWVNGDTLVAYVNVWPASLTPRGGFAYYSTSTDGLTWSAIRQVKMSDGTVMKGIIEQDPHSLPNGRIVNAAHFQPGLIAAPVYSDDQSGVRGWKRATYTNMTYSGDVTREIEPSWFWQRDGSAVMIFRDQTSTFRKLAAKSTDNGKTWSTAVITDMPDSRAKQSAGNLPDGTAYMVHNPVTGKNRYPLAIVLSQDGQVFDRAFVMRKGGSDLQAQIYTGTAKTLGYSYPKSLVWNGYLYAAYSTNKEDVEYTRIPLSSLGMTTQCVFGTMDKCNKCTGTMTGLTQCVVSGKYIYNYDNSGNLSWNNVNSWTPAAVPGSADTVIIRKGEVQINNLSHTGPVYVESEGVLRLVTASSSVSNIYLQGGTLKVYTSNPELALTSNIKVEAPSTIMAGSQPATVFTLNGTITGNYDLTKTSVGILRVNSNAAGFKGNWVVSEGRLQQRSINGLGLCGVQIKSGARLDIEVPGTSIYSLKIDSLGGVDLDNDLTAEVTVLGNENVLSGSWSGSVRPAWFGSTGKLTVKSSLISYSGSAVLCPGTELKLQAASGTSYIWKNGSAQVGTASACSATSPGSYTVTATNSNGCRITSAPANIKSDSCTITAIGGGISENKEIRVYPNPFADKTSIHYSGHFRYQLYDSRGGLVEEGYVSDKMEIGKDLTRGLYLLRIENKVIQIIKD
jgi:hypothetical protein